jgi:hypothetical protein
MSTAASPTTNKTGLRSRLRQRFGALRAKRSRPSEPAVLSRRLVWCLRLTLLVDGVAAVGLALGELNIDAGLAGTVGAGILLVIGIANLWALRLRRLSWPRDVTIAQAPVVVVSLYIVLVESRRTVTLSSPVVVIAALMGIVAVCWLIRLRKAGTLQWSKTAAIVVALCPLVGLVQFWLQTEYLPSTSKPLVDVTADLSPMGRSGPIIRLSAKVTIHNRATVPVTIVGGLMWVTTYPAPAPATSRSTPFGVDLSGLESRDFRIPPVDPSLGTLILLHTGEEALLPPGGTDITQREVDIGSTTGLTRLSVRAIFLTEDRIDTASTCTYPAIYRTSRDFFNFVEQVRKGIRSPIGEAAFCANYHVKPVNVVQALGNPPPVLQVIVVLPSNSPAREDPALLFKVGYLRGNIGGFAGISTYGQKAIENSYPMGFESGTAEYAPTDPTPTPTPTPPGGAP